MPITIVLAASAVAAAVPMLWWSVSSTRPDERHTASQNLAKGQSMADMRHLLLQRSASERAVRPAVRSIAARMRRLTPAGWIETLDKRIIYAGVQRAWPIERVLAAKGLLALVGLGTGLLFLTRRPDVIGAVVAAFLTFFGYMLPDLMLGAKASERQSSIERALPDTLDQLSISVEAGLGFEAAMDHVSTTGKGAIAEEFGRTLGEMNLGVSRAKALKGLTARNDVPDLHHFVLAVVQSEAYGIPVARVLRVQSRELRIKRRQRAEERAVKIPVKMIFPLLFCIFPSLFIVLLGPAMIRIARSLFGIVIQ